MSDVPIKKCPPGIVPGAGDLNRWASRRLAGRSGVPDIPDKTRERQLARSAKRARKWARKQAALAQRDFDNKAKAQRNSVFAKLATANQRHIEKNENWLLHRMVTKADIERAKTPAGGWTRAQLAEWGVPWPPPKGWKRRLENPESQRVANHREQPKRSPTRVDLDQAADARVFEENGKWIVALHGERHAFETNAEAWSWLDRKERRTTWRTPFYATDR